MRGGPGGGVRKSCERLVLFANPLSAIGAVLTGAVLRAARTREDLTVVAICDTARRTPRPALLRAVEILAATALERVFDPRTRRFRPPALVGSLPWLAARFAVPYLVPAGRSINSSEFAAYLSDELRPTMALSLGCVQIFRRELLERFAIAVNYHNGLLPQFRGLRATSWSLYRGEGRTGYSFHRMTEHIDAGPILLSEELPVVGEMSVGGVERAKTYAAAARLGDLLDLMMARAPGVPQFGGASYYGLDDYRSMTVIDSPEALTVAELQRRLRAFGVLRLSLGGEMLEVSRLVRARGEASSPTAFRTADGVAVRATRFLSFPLPVYRIVRRFRPPVHRE